MKNVGIYLSIFPLFDVEKNDMKRSERKDKINAKLIKLKLLKFKVKRINRKKRKIYFPFHVID